MLAELDGTKLLADPVLRSRLLLIQATGRPPDAAALHPGVEPRSVVVVELAWNGAGAWPVPGSRASS